MFHGAGEQGLRPAGAPLPPNALPRRFSRGSIRRLAVGRSFSRPFRSERLEVNYKRLGILLTHAPAGGHDAPPAPSSAAAPARELRTAFLADLLARLSKLKKVSVTVFREDEAPEPAGDSLDRRALRTANTAVIPGRRIEDAIRVLAPADGQFACLVGAESPDVPLVYIKRAYVKLKHKDVVLGPTLDGGLYLVGVKALVPGLFDGLAWGAPGLFAGTLARAARTGLACAVLPPWYAVHTEESLSFLETMMLARRIEKRDRLSAVEKALDAMRRGSK